MKRWFRILCRHRRRAFSCLVWALALLLAYFGLIRAVDTALRPTFREAARMEAGRLAEEALDRALQEAVSAFDAKTLVTLRAREGITALQVDAAGAAGIRAAASQAALQRLSSLRSAGFRIPLGSALGIGLLSGRGPTLRAAIYPVGRVQSSVVSSFEEAGVNQTCHRLTLTLHTEVAVLIPGEKLEISVEASVPLTETVLVGSVPAVYVTG